MEGLRKLRKELMKELNTVTDVPIRERDEFIRGYYLGLLLARNMVNDAISDELCKEDEERP